MYCDKVPLNDDYVVPCVIHDVCTDLEHKSFDTMLFHRYYYCIILYVCECRMQKKSNHRNVTYTHIQNGAINLVQCQCIINKDKNS